MAGRSHDASPAYKAVVVTKSDATIISTTRAIYVGGTGDVAVKMADGGTATFSAVPVGTVLPIQVSQVLSTGTTATLMLALY